MERKAGESCTGKKQYRRFGEADAKKKEFLAGGSPGMCVYRCEFCKQYHVGQHIERRSSRRLMAERKENKRQRGLRMLAAWLDEMVEEAVSGAPTSAAGVTWNG